MGSSLRARPYTFKALGLYDALDGEGAPDGACFSLQNLVHDVTTPYLWMGRPAATSLTTFSSFSQPGVISVLLNLGTRVYGMIGTARNNNCDEPFCFETATNTFITISGVTGSNVPTTQAATGAWTPPTMAVMGSKILVTHPGFSGSGSNFFGVIDISTPASPAWSANNTTGTALPSVPLAVAQFNNRAYFGCANTSYYTDVLALNLTNSTQFLTHGGTGTSITGYGSIGLEQTQGGILAGIICFKPDGFWQITGDPATSNQLNNGPFIPGCSAPRTIAQGPMGIGLLYMANDGIRIIDPSGQVQGEPIIGVRQPFAVAFTPSRAAACYNSTVYRVALQTTTNPITSSNAFVEYWYDFEINQWGGPHTWSSDCIVPLGNSFCVSSNRNPGALYKSDQGPSSTSSVTELGTSIAYNLQSALLAQDSGMSMKAVIEASVNIDFAATGSVALVQMLSATGGIVGTATITAAGGTYWNQFNWNQANWSAATYGLRAYNVDWTAPVVYKNSSVSVQGTLTANLRLGPIRLRTEELGYMNDQVPA